MEALFVQTLQSLNILNLQYWHFTGPVTAHPQRYLLRLPDSLKSQIAAFLSAVCQLS